MKIQKFTIGILLQYGETVEVCFFNCQKAKDFIGTYMMIGNLSSWLKMLSSFDNGEDRVATALNFASEDEAIAYYNSLYTIFEEWN
ncbi:MAG: hypothetical protein K2Y14_01020 [Burkholderiales bacterium]|nr:hypothetical protein [Burkholderiales bacterium]